MNKHLLKLATFLLSIDSAFRKTRAGTGFITNNISVVQANASQIKTLCEPLGYTLLEMPPKYNKETNSMSPHMFYLGEVKSNKCLTPEDFILDD